MINTNEKRHSEGQLDVVWISLKADVALLRSDVGHLKSHKYFRSLG